MFSSQVLSARAVRTAKADSGWGSPLTLDTRCRHIRRKDSETLLALSISPVAQTLHMGRQASSLAATSLSYLCR